MLGKLLKHEFRATGRVMLPVLGAVTVLALLFNISIRFLDKTDSAALTALFVIIIILFVLSVIAAFVIALVLMVQRFYKNMLGDEGYLSFTLPVTVDELVWSKLIVSFVWFLVTFLAVMLLIFGTVYSMNYSAFAEILREFPSWQEIADILRGEGVDPSSLLGIFGASVLIAILSTLVNCLHFYAAMSLGQMFSDHKGLFSVLFFLGINFVFQFISGIVGQMMGGLGFFNFNGLYFAAEFGSLSDAMGTFWSLVGLNLASTVIFGVILYFTTTLSLKKKLNLA